MCEIEHFVRGDDKSYHKFGLVREVTLTLFGRDGQMGDGKCVQMTVGDAGRFASLVLESDTNDSGTGSDQQRDSRIFYGTNFLALVQDRRQGRADSIPPTSSQRNGALCLRLLGCRATHLLRGCLLFAIMIAIIARIVCRAMSNAPRLVSQGWIECVGHADRACYDLSVHSAATKVDLTAYEDYATPVSLFQKKQSCHPLFSLTFLFWLDNSQQYFFSDFS